MLEQPRLAWHVHHDNLCDWVPREKDFKDRIEYIKKHKPIIQIGTRLRLMHYVSDQAAVAEALEVYQAARKEALKVHDAAVAEAWKVHEAWKVPEALEVYQAARDKALEVYQAANAEALKPLEKLHSIECKNCPWDGDTIFP